MTPPPGPMLATEIANDGNQCGSDFKYYQRPTSNLK